MVLLGLPLVSSQHMFLFLLHLNPFSQLIPSWIEHASPALAFALPDSTQNLLPVLSISVHSYPAQHLGRLPLMAARASSLIESMLSSHIATPPAAGVWHCFFLASTEQKTVTNRPK